MIPLRASEKLFQVLNDAQLHVFGHYGHWTQLEQTATFNRLVRDSLTEERVMKKSIHEYATLLHTAERHHIPIAPLSTEESKLSTLEAYAI